MRFLQPRAEPEIALVLARPLQGPGLSVADVLGGTPTAIAGLDLWLLGCILRRNGRIQHTGAGAAVMGSPLQAATWLANTLGTRGVELEPGQIILTATLDRLGTVTAVFD